MNRITQLFNRKKEGVFSLYFCAGSPVLDHTLKVIQDLENEGVDLIEIGIPFSDPIADGVIIQQASNQALENGMSLKKLFFQLKDVRKTVSIPLVLMGYLNPIMQYGFEKFCVSCQDIGIDGIIIPDLPFKDYIQNYKPLADKYNIKIIMLITPETSTERVQLIDNHTDGFIYMVSSASTTGAQNSFNEQKKLYFERIKQMNLKNPRMIGFGISNKQTFEMANRYASGCIIGSKFVQLLSENQGDAKKAVTQLREMLQK